VKSEWGARRSVMGAVVAARQTWRRVTEERRSSRVAESSSHVAESSSRVAESSSRVAERFSRVAESSRGPGMRPSCGAVVTLYRLRGHEPQALSKAGLCEPGRHG